MPSKADQFCDCGKPVHARGLCNTCYRRTRRRADPEKAKNDFASYYQRHAEQISERRKSKRGTAGERPYRKQGTPPAPRAPRRVSLVKPPRHIVPGSTFEERMRHYREIYEAAQKRKSTT